MTLTLRPCSRTMVHAHLKRVHKLSPPTGYLCALAVYDALHLACIAILGRPSARLLQETGGGRRG